MEPESISKTSHNNQKLTPIQSSPKLPHKSPSTPESPKAGKGVLPALKTLFSRSQGPESPNQTALNKYSPLSNNISEASIQNPPGEVTQMSLEHRMESLKVSRPTLTVKDFTIIKTLGTGSFGRVHLVKLIQSGAYFAMKALRKAEIVKLRQVEHTLNEKTILDQISMPFTVNLLCTFQDVYHLFIVMEYVSGGEMFRYCYTNLVICVKREDFHLIAPNFMRRKLYLPLNSCMLGI